MSQVVFRGGGMMREILFRGKTISNIENKTSTWHYGVPVPVKNNMSDTNDMELIKYVNYDELDYWEACYMSYDIDPTTLGQYTGLKDKNGTKIFEGDIVKVSDKFIDIVVYELGCFMLKKPVYGYEFTYQNFNNIEVIGNIHDNPELLEKVE